MEFARSCIRVRSAMAQVESYIQGSNGPRPAGAPAAVVNKLNERGSSSSLGERGAVDKSKDASSQSTWTARDFTFGRLFGHGSYSKVSGSAFLTHAALIIAGPHLLVRPTLRRESTVLLVTYFARALRLRSGLPCHLGCNRRGFRGEGDG